MSTIVRTLVSTAVGGVLVSGALPAPSAQGMQVMDESILVLLSVTGDKGVRVRGQCILERASGIATIGIEETIPFERQLRGDGLRCVLHADGRVLVEASKDCNRTRAATNGGQVTINLR